MSLENAIITHAAALSELAAAIRAGFGGAFAPVKMVEGERIKGTIVDTSAAEVKPDAELDADDRREVLHAAQAKAMAAVEEKKAAAKAKADKAKKEADAAAVQAALDAAQAEAAAGDDGLGDDLDGDGPTLDYKADVRPVLLDAIKRTDKLQVQALVKSYGVDKAENLDPAKFAEIVAKAKKMGV